MSTVVLDITRLVILGKRVVTKMVCSSSIVVRSFYGSSTHRLPLHQTDQFSEPSITIHKFSPEFVSIKYRNVHSGRGLMYQTVKRGGSVREKFNTPRYGFDYSERIKTI